MELILKKYGAVISDEDTGNRILGQIKSALAQNQNVIVNFDGVSALTTYNAKQIFGDLYVNLGAQEFYDKIGLRNASANIQTIIRLGINSSVLAAKI